MPARRAVHFCTSFLLLSYTMSAFGQSHTWTDSSDFEIGLQNNTVAVSNTLQISTGDMVLPYLWVACTERNTIVRVATSTEDPITGRSNVQPGDILGEYYSAPDGCRQVSTGTVGPSRTAVDFDGNLWVGNRHNTGSGQGHIIKLGNGLAGSDWKDRDLDDLFTNTVGQLDTSTGLGDFRPWPNTSGCDSGDESEAYDELILMYRTVDASVIRHVTVDRRNNVWVGGTGDRTLGLIDGRTGFLLESDPTFGPDFPFTTYTCSGQQAGGYGGVVDRFGFVWSTSGDPQLDYTLRLNPANGTTDCYAVNYSYGLAIDLENDLWISEHGSAFANVFELAAPDYSSQAALSLGAGQTRLRAVAVTPDNDVWVVSSDGDRVHRIDQAGATSTPIPFGNLATPTGVVVDPSGFVWVTNRGTDEVVRIDPSDNSTTAFDLGENCTPYNYTDMTGVNLMWTIAPAGTWSAVYDSEEAGTFWGTVSWQADLSGHAENQIHVSIRAADVETDLGKAVYMDVEDGVRFTCARCIDQFNCQAIRGRYVQVRVQLNAMSHDPQTWPTLQSITVEADETASDCNDNGIPDECDVLSGLSEDCNENGIPDECDVADETSQDCCPLACTVSGIQDCAAVCPGFGVPDECKPDCNDNGVPDGCDIIMGRACDRNGDGVPDECFACCVDGACENLIGELCTASSGTFYSGVTCESGGSGFVPCADDEFACCTGETCTVELVLACLQGGGFPYTAIASCDSNPCSTGACCISGVCTDTSVVGGPMIPSECSNEYHGGVNCTSSPCDPLLPLPPDPPDPDGIDKNRYVSFTPDNYESGTALRVRLHQFGANQPWSENIFSAYHGETRWIGEPGQYADIWDESSFWASGLRCTRCEGTQQDPCPNWGSFDLVHVYGAEILPNSAYDIEVVLLGDDCASARTCPQCPQS